MSTHAEISPKAKTRLRLMQLTDLPQVLEVEKRAYTFPWSARLFEDCLQVGYLCWVLEVEQQLAGYGLMMLAAGEAHVLNLCVDPQFQGQGYGRKILEHLLVCAQKNKAEEVFLEVRVSNLVAIALYDKAGFNQIGIRKNYYQHGQVKEDAIMLAKSLL